MTEGQRPRMKSDPEMTIQSDQPARRPVLSIAEDGQPSNRELNAELMASAGPGL
jgi:hypothetical protein